MTGLIDVKIAERISWGKNLITLRLERTENEFLPGQFFNIGLEVDGEIIRRSYSAASAPGKHLEFFFSRVSEGALTPPLFDLKSGSLLKLDPQALGYFVLDELPPAHTLWLVGTGTGLGPYISMIRSGEIFERFGQVVLVHGVRHPHELAYAEELRHLSKNNPQLTYISVLSAKDLDATEIPPEALRGRITNVWQDGSLEKVSAPFEENAHMMLCGNPLMIKEMVTLLKERGLKKHKRREAGHFTFEKYW